MKAQPAPDSQAAKRVVDHVKRLVQSGTLQPGDKMPAEREFARELGISRASLRAGIAKLAAMGLVIVKHGVGAFIATAPLAMDPSSFDVISSVHKFSPEQLYEARFVLEGCLARMAARNRTSEHLAALADSVTEMFACLKTPKQFLLHDIRFHRTIAQASGNPILALLMETIAASFYDARKMAEPPIAHLKEAAEMHRRIYRAIRDRNGVAAQTGMELHLKSAAVKVTQDRRRSKKIPSTQSRYALRTKPLVN